jgi:hypothetical protein
MTGFEPGLEPLGCERDRVGLGDADRVEAERLGALDEGALERLAVLYRGRRIPASIQSPLVLIML